jgi:tetratricopeptide (TPR) repeat protein
VESVAWVSERKDVLSAFFWMLMLCCYVYYTEKPIIKRYLLVLFSFILALMSKPMVITLPLIMILLDYWPLNRFQSQKSNLFLWQLKEKLPFFVLSLILVFITFYTPGDNVSYEFLPLEVRLANAPVAFVTYLIKTFWPQDMAVFYPFPAFIPSWKVIGALMLIFLITLAGIITVKRQPYLFTGWSWYAITIIPVIGIVQIGDFTMADRYHYLPSIGLGMMLAWGMPPSLKNENVYKMILFPVAITFLILLSFLAWKQCSYWKNSITVFSHALDATKNNYLAHNNLGLALFSKGKTDEAITHYNDVICLRPLDVVPLQNKAIVYAKLGQYQLAIESYNEVIRLKPDYADAYHSRAIIYYGLGQYPKALEDFHKAIRLKPDHAEAYNNRANVYLQLGQYQKAIEDMNKAVSLKPDEAAIFYNRGNFYINLARHQQAIEDYTKAVSLKPAYAEAYNNRAFAYLNLGQYQQALEDYNKAILLKPNYADAYNNRAFVYLTTGNTDAGCLDAKKACEMGTCSTLQLASGKGLCR